LVEYFERNGIPEPDFTSTSPEHPIDHEFDAIRIDLTQSAQDLILLAEGPLQWLRTFMCSHHDFAAWQIALRFKFFSIIPLDKPMSVKDIASATKMDEDRLERVMKLLATQRCFNEVEEGVFEHTALSVFIAQNKDIEATIAFQYGFIITMDGFQFVLIVTIGRTSSLKHLHLQPHRLRTTRISVILQTPLLLFALARHHTNITRKIRSAVLVSH
jgi:hypothetical protein